MTHKMITQRIVARTYIQRFVIAFVILLMGLTAFALGDLRTVYADDIASGTVREVPWKITAEGELQIGEEGKDYSIDSVWYTGWYNYTDKVKKVTILGSVNLKGDCGSLFSGLSQCTEMDLRGLDTKDVTEMDDMFFGCSSLQRLNLSNFDMTKVQNMGQMFYSCNLLAEIALGPNCRFTENCDLFFSDLKRYSTLDGTSVQGPDIGSIDHYDGTSPGWYKGWFTGRCGDNIEYMIEDRVLTLNGTGEMYDYENWEDSPFQFTKYDKLIFSDGITSIGKNAFWNCPATEVKLPKGLTTIGEFAFLGNQSTKVIFPEGLKIIGEDAFSGSNISEISFPDSVTVIERGAFSDCDNLSSVRLPKSLKEVGSNTFYNCPKLESVTGGICGKNITWEWSKHDGEGLLALNGTGATYDEPIEGSIPSEVLFEALEYDKLSISEGITRIGAGIFSMCSVKEVAFPASLTSIRAMAFCGSNLTELYIPDGVTELGDWAFENCEQLRSVRLSKNIDKFGDDVFWNCGNLTSVTLPKGLKMLGDSAFGNCRSLTDVTLPEGMKKIGARAFYGCTKLTNVQISSTVKTIGGDAFVNCTSMKSMRIPQTVETIGDEAVGFTVNSKNQYKVIPGFKIYGYDGSSAHGYAVLNSVKPIAYVSLGKMTCRVPSITKLQKGKKSFTVKWTRTIPQYTGYIGGSNKYQIQYGLKSNFKGAKTKSVQKYKTSQTIKGLKAKKTYYVRIRTLSKIGKKTYYSKWSNKKTVKTK